MKMMRKIITCTLALTLFVVTAAQAHDMWLETKGNKAKLIYGHPGKTDPYPRSKVNSICGITENNWTVPLEFFDGKGDVYAVIADRYSMLTADFTNQYWYNTDEEGWRNFKNPVEIRGTVLEEGFSLKLTKDIITWEPFMSKPIGQRAEIVPLKDPTKLKEGDMLPVMLYFEGKPMPAEGARISGTSDVTIEHPQLVNLKTSKPFNVKIGPAGPQIITAKYQRTLDDTHRMWWALSLSFKTEK